MQVDGNRVLAAKGVGKIRQLFSFTDFPNLEHINFQAYPPLGMLVRIGAFAPYEAAISTSKREKHIWGFYQHLSCNRLWV